MAHDQPDARPSYRIFWGRLQSFKYAGQGIVFMLRTQHNAWIHATISGIAIAAGILLHISAAEWCWLVLAMASVWTAESFNTALELIVDIASPERRPAAGHAKDIGAGAVLLCSLGAATVGFIVFLPHLLAVLRGA
jgi:diacylglycerol kinase (ATP)